MNSSHVRHVGFAAGPQILQIGTVSDVKLFYSCIPHAAIHRQDKPWEVIFDRLYRRYLRPEDLQHAVALMAILKTWFFAEVTKTEGLQLMRAHRYDEALASTSVSLRWASTGPATSPGCPTPCWR